MRKQRVENEWVLKTYDKEYFHPLLYILTDENWEDEYSVKWGHEITCTSGGRSSANYMTLEEYRSFKPREYYYAYTHPILASLMARKGQTVMWEAAGNIKCLNVDETVMCSMLRSNKLVGMPFVSTYTRMKFGFACAHKVYGDKGFYYWILNWVSGKDRTKITAYNWNLFFDKKISEEAQSEYADWDLVKLYGAANWMAMAAMAFADDHDDLVGHYTSLAATDCSQVSHVMRIDFSLKNITECVMSPYEC